LSAGSLDEVGEKEEEKEEKYAYMAAIVTRRAKTRVLNLIATS